MKIFTNTYFLVVLLIILALIDIMTGTISIWSKETDVYTILMELRIPKMLTAIATGGALSIGGLVLQILFRNPLAGPYVLGISSASSLFASIGIMGTGLLGAGIWYHLSLNAFSIIGALLGLLVILLILRMTSQITVILLIGLMLSQLYAAIQSILSYLSTEHSLKIYTIWTMGSIQNTDIFQSLILFLTSVTGILWILKYTKALMVYMTGEETARVMGVSIHKMRRRLITGIAIIVGIITAYCGPIALVGMSIPIFVRILCGDANVMKWMIQSYLYGGIFLLLTDVMNQVLFNGSLPLNILISMWGVPLMIWILLRQMKLIIS